MKYKSCKKLKILDVSGSYLLTKTGNFIGLENLEELGLRECTNLEKLDSSIGCLQKLVRLDLRYCRRLKRLPWEMIGKLSSLQTLDLEECPNLKHFSLWNTGFPIFHAQLTEIQLSHCTNLKSIPDLPQSIKKLCLSYCRNLVNLPSNCSELQFLTNLRLDNCCTLGSYRTKKSTLFNLSQNSFSSLPESFSNLSQLEILCIDRCSQLQLLPPLPSQLTYIGATKCGSLDVMPFDSMQNAFFKVFKESLTSTKGLYITLSGKEVPEWFTYRNSGNVLSFVLPIQFDSKICGLILCATKDEVDEFEWVCPIIYNKTKGTSHRFSGSDYRDVSMMVMFYPLNDTTLVVEAGDTVELQFQFHKECPHHLRYTECLHFIKSGGLLLVYEDEVVDSGLVLKEVNLIGVQTKRPPRV
ncbi:TMV resistance protein N [Artemisia annua]|uniref:TMV resistance protein N n=1 Tax=Artemisia annua TaxID=35608 RepID=A0A2U1MWN7_ARTAN|nr:TMV resistance protein N [Artemisia annua]